MDINEVLAKEIIEAKEMLEKNDYLIDSLEYINEPPGVVRVIRIKKLQENKVEILVAYHNDMLMLNI